MIFSQATLVALLLAIATTASPANARGTLRHAGARRLSPTAECTLQVQVPLHIDPDGFDGEDEEVFECELDPSETGGIPNMIFPLGIDQEQKKELKQMLKDGDLKPNDATLAVAGATWNGLEVKLPPGKLKEKVNNGKKFAIGRRHLGTLDKTGDKPSKSK
jgi:hypothetical protein